MTLKDTAESGQETRPREYPNLDRHYGSIGISAVVAALRYQDGTKPADALAAPREEPAPRKRLPDAA